MAVIIDNMKKIIRTFPNKDAFVDEKHSITFKEFDKETKCIAEIIINEGVSNVPILLFLGRCVEHFCAQFGIVRSRNFPVVMDINVPKDRLLGMLNKTKPKIVVTDVVHLDQVKELIAGTDIKIIMYEDAMKSVVDEERLKKVEESIDDDDIYKIEFSSGSTGNPKAVITYGGLLKNNNTFIRKGYDLESLDLRIAVTAPVFYAAIIWQEMLPVCMGATLYLVPEKFNKEPANLMKYLYDNKINVIDWVTSLLSNILATGCLDKPYLSEMKYIFFCGEPMLGRVINKWRECYKNIRFINLYGSAECTENLFIYEIEKDYPDNLYIPIGTMEVVENGDALLINEKGEKAKIGDKAEVYFKVFSKTYGYYNDPERTSESFVLNPIDSSDKNIYYKSCDIVEINKDGELQYVSRIGTEINYMGHRINLVEIETSLLSNQKVIKCAAVYSEEKKQIGLAYVGDISDEEVLNTLKNKIPNYMMPKKLLKLEKLPENTNGKLDRIKLGKMF